MKITKIGQLKRPKDQSAVYLADELSALDAAVGRFAKVYDSEHYRKAYAGDLNNKTYKEAFAIDSLVSQYKKKFEGAILDIANTVLQLSDKDGKLYGNNTSDYATALPMSPLEEELVRAKQKLLNFVDKPRPKSAKTRLEEVEDALKGTLATLGEIKEKAEKSRDLGSSPLDEIPTESAAILFATSLLHIGTSKFLPETRQTGLGKRALRYINYADQGLRYMNYAFLAASAAVLLAKGGSALKKKLQDKKNNDKERQDPPALQ